MEVSAGLAGPRLKDTQMNKPTTRSIAKELLVFLGCFLLGIVVIPLIITFFDTGTTYKDVLDSFFVNPQMGAWFVAASPYIFYLLIRMII
jgi:hypothetical protein